MLFLHSPHHHAQVTSFDYDPDALRFNRLLDGLGNLSGQALLDLQAPRENLDEPWNFAQPNDLSFGDISHVHLAEKRQHVVLAEAEHLYVFYYNHLVVTDC